MILIVHNGYTVEDVSFVKKKEAIKYNPNESIITVLKNISIKYPEHLLIWVKNEYKTLIDFNEINKIFHHKCIMASYSVSGHYCIAPQIGYVEQTPYTNIERSVKYPTWLMSSDVGGVFAETFNNIIDTVLLSSHTDYALTCLAKHNMPIGLFCYSNPKFLKQIPSQKTDKKPSNVILFKFVKQHYKLIWVFNLFICFLIFERKFLVLSFLSAFLSKGNRKAAYLNPLNNNSTKSVIGNKTIDVVIPTIGRRDHLYNFLKDLTQQTLLPSNVIIVEQSLNEELISELDFLENEEWPFNIKHKLLYNSGVCKARNIAIELVESDWCFFADDDIKIESNVIVKAFNTIEILGIEVLNLLCLQPHQSQSYFYVSQTDIFGSGTSIVKSSLLTKLRFDTKFEFGFGEDSDFGMQLRNTGVDIIYIPTIKIIHLKAPIGGFRTKYVTKWYHEDVQPKPSPTIMLFIKKYYNDFQKNGYKFTLFLKFYKKQSIKNPFKYLKQMKLQWYQSEFWSENLLKNEG